MAGDEGFDPLGLSNLDDSLGLDLYWMREAELKHCRVAMLATVGFFGQELGVVLPGMVSSRFDATRQFLLTLQYLRNVSIQPHAKNQIDAFWQLFHSNPGPIFASFIFMGIVEGKRLVTAVR